MVGCRLTWRALSPRCNVSSSSVTGSAYAARGVGVTLLFEEMDAFFSKSDIANAQRGEDQGYFTIGEGKEGDA